MPALKDNNNLTTWMLEVTSNSVESKLCVGLMRLHESKRVLIIVTYRFGLFIYLFIYFLLGEFCKTYCRHIC